MEWAACCWLLDLDCKIMYELKFRSKVQKQSEMSWRLGQFDPAFSEAGRHVDILETKNGHDCKYDE